MESVYMGHLKLYNIDRVELTTTVENETTCYALRLTGQDSELNVKLEALVILGADKPTVVS